MRSYRTSFVLLAMLLGAAPAAQAVATCPPGNALSTPTADFTVDAVNQVVTHNKTGLMWKQCAEGWSGAGCATGSSIAKTWSAALTAAAADTTAGYNDWRLPNQKELQSIVETGCHSPSINEAAFPNTLTNLYFWSSTAYASLPDTAWRVLFLYGKSLPGSKAGPYYVRLVRSGQLFDSFDAQGDITPPVLTAAGVSGTTATATTLAATSDEAATGYWIVVPQGSAAPTAAQVKAGANYGAVTLSASGNGAMTAAVAKSFSVSGLTAATAYDLYLVAEDASSNHNLTPTTQKVQFTTTSSEVNRIVLDPTTPTTLYAAISNDGVYKKVAAGAWTASNTGLTNLYVKDLVIKDSSTLYAGTDGGGVFKSTDSGATWAACLNANAGMTNPNIRSLALAGATLYAGTAAGVFTSSDGCATWSAMSDGLP